MILLFWIACFLARIHALGRRADNKVDFEVFETGTFVFDPNRLEGKVNDQIVHFTAKEKLYALQKKEPARKRAVL